jgi:hypothetical protein
MKTAVSLHDGLEARIADGLDNGPRTGDASYPTRRLQRGLVLLDDGRDLSDEGVGFGVPVLKRGVETVFPGGMALTATAAGLDWQVTATYRLDLVERLATRYGRTVRPRLVYAAKDSLAAAHRGVPALRGPLAAASSAVRRWSGWTTTYEPVGLVATIPVTYTVRRGDSVVTVDVDLNGVPAGSVTEIALMNELGAGHFDGYEDSSGASLAGADVGTWDEVHAARASFVSTRRTLAFTLARVPGARLMRGREVVAGRLAWAGFGYVLRPGPARFSYEVRVERRGGGDGP